MSTQQWCSAAFHCDAPFCSYFCSDLCAKLQATEDKNAAMAQAEKTSAKAKLAERLISGLSGEFQRWTVTIKELTEAEGQSILSAKRCPIVNHVHDQQLQSSCCTFAELLSHYLMYLDVHLALLWRPHLEIA